MKYETLREFVREHGEVKVWSARKKVRTLKTGGKDLLDIFDKAERFEYNGRSYTKAEFEKVVEASK